MRRCLLGVGENARGLDNDIDSMGFPWNLARIRRLRYGDLFAVYKEVSVARLDHAVEAPIIRVVLQQVRVCFGIDEVVDGNHFKVVWMPLHDRLKNLAPNAT